MFGLRINRLNHLAGHLNWGNRLAPPPSLDTERPAIPIMSERLLPAANGER